MNNWKKKKKKYTDYIKYEPWLLQKPQQQASPLAAGLPRKRRRYSSLKIKRQN